MDFQPDDIGPEHDAAGVRGIGIKHLAARYVACARGEGSWERLPQCLEQLRSRMAQGHLKAIGPPSGIYFNSGRRGSLAQEWGVFYPIEAASYREAKKAPGLLKIPPLEVAMLVHRGSYREAGVAYRLLSDYLFERGLGISRLTEEVYLTDAGGFGEQPLVEIRMPLGGASDGLIPSTW